MKKIALLIVLLQVSWLTSLQAQEKDRFGFIMDLSGSIMVVPISGIFEISESDLTELNSRLVPVSPVYRRIDTTGWATKWTVHAGMNLPLIRQKTWSAGLQINAGFGYQQGIIALKGISDIALNFPSYVYYRNYSSNFDFSILAGYQYTYSPISYNLMMGAFDINVEEDLSVRFFGSVRRDKFYSYLTNGTYEPAITIGEYGMALIGRF